MKYKLCSIGECMIELSEAKNKSFVQSFAGDTLNFCNYLNKNLFKPYFFTSIGNSVLNKELLNFLKDKGISIKLVNLSKKFETGLYLIINKKNGEKQFFYWRDQSAAKNYFNKLNFDKVYKDLQKFNFIYFSGITLSIINYSRLLDFLKIVEKLKIKNIKVIFDFNIRISRWNISELTQTLNKTLDLVDICFASGEDLKYWKKKSSFEFFIKILKKHNIQHGIYRKSAEYNYAYLRGTKYKHKNKLIKNVVDTSGAGDGYNASYLSNFMKNEDPKKALQEASKIGEKIIMKKGAIVDA